VFHKSSIAVSQIALPDVSTFECLAVSIASDSHKVILVVIYRPGSATITRSFYDEFENVVCTVMAINQNFALVCDVFLTRTACTNTSRCQHTVTATRLTLLSPQIQHLCPTWVCPTCAIFQITSASTSTCRTLQPIKRSAL